MNDSLIRDIIDQLLRPADYYVEYRQKDAGQGWRRIDTCYNGYTGLEAYQLRVDSNPENDYRLVCVTQPTTLILKDASKKELTENGN